MWRFISWRSPCRRPRIFRMGDEVLRRGAPALPWAPPRMSGDDPGRPIPFRLVVVRCEVAAGLVDLGIVPEAGGEREQALRDADGETLDRVGVVVFERELTFEGVDDRLDPLTDGAEQAVAARLVLAVVRGTDPAPPDQPDSPGTSGLLTPCREDRDASRAPHLTRRSPVPDLRHRRPG